MRKTKLIVALVLLGYTVLGQKTNCECTPPSLSFLQTLSQSSLSKKEDLLKKECYNWIDEAYDNGKSHTHYLGKCPKAYTGDNKEKIVVHEYSFSFDTISDFGFLFTTYNKKVYDKVKHDIELKGKFLRHVAGSDEYTFQEKKFEFTPLIREDKIHFYNIFDRAH